MPESMKKNPVIAQPPVQAKPAAGKKKAPAAPAPANYPPRPAVPRQPHAQSAVPKKKLLPPPAKPARKAAAPAAPAPAAPAPRQEDPSPAEDILELEDIVSTLQTQNPAPESTEEALFDFDSQSAAAPQPAAPAPAPGGQPAAGQYAVQESQDRRPRERFEYRTSGVRKLCDTFADLEPFFTKTTLVQAGLGALVLMLVFLAGVYIGSTPPEPEPAAPSVPLQPRVELLSTAAVRDLGAKSADFGPSELANVMIRFIVEQSGRDVYVLRYSRGGEPSLFTVDFPNQTIVQTEGVTGSGLILTWKGFVLERLRAAAQGQDLEVTPQGASPASLQRF